MSSFKSSGKTWQIAGGFKEDMNKPNLLNISKGTGILVNHPDKRNKGEDLYSVAEYGMTVAMDRPGLLEQCSALESRCKLWPD